MVQRYGGVYFLSRQNPALMAALLFIDCSSSVFCIPSLLISNRQPFGTGERLETVNEAYFLQIKSGDLERVCTWRGLHRVLLDFTTRLSGVFLPPLHSLPLPRNLAVVWVSNLSSFIFPQTFVLYSGAVSSPWVLRITLLETKALLGNL